MCWGCRAEGGEGRRWTHVCVGGGIRSLASDLWRCIQAYCVFKGVMVTILWHGQQVLRWAWEKGTTNIKVHSVYLITMMALQSSDSNTVMTGERQRSCAHVQHFHCLPDSSINWLFGNQHQLCLFQSVRLRGGCREGRSREWRYNKEIKRNEIDERWTEAGLNKITSD